MTDPIATEENASEAVAHGGVISAVRGRALGRGVPEAHTMTVKTSDGRTINAWLPLPKGPVAVKGRAILGVVGAERFDSCPICGDPDPASRDHVPPESIGGAIVVYTCTKCNNMFGARYEAPFKNWYNGSVGTLRVRGPGAVGNRVLGEVLLRQTDAGPDMLIPITDGDPAAWDIVETGLGRVSVRPPDLTDIRIAAVKSAYLAACSLLGEIPDTAQAAKLRKELMSVRDVRRGTAPSVGPVMAGLRVLRGPQEPKPGEVTLVHLPRWADRQYWICFHDSVFVEWPLELGLLLPHLRNANARKAAAG